MDHTAIGLQSTSQDQDLTTPYSTRISKYNDDQSLTAPLETRTSQCHRGPIPKNVSNNHRETENLTELVTHTLRTSSSRTPQSTRNDRTVPAESNSNRPQYRAPRQCITTTISDTIIPGRRVLRSQHKHGYLPV